MPRRIVKISRHDTVRIADETTVNREWLPRNRSSVSGSILRMASVFAMVADGDADVEHEDAGVESSTD